MIAVRSSSRADMSWKQRPKHAPDLNLQLWASDGSRMISPLTPFSWFLPEVRSHATDFHPSPHDTNPDLV